jgi:hypothetical protein
MRPDPAVIKANQQRLERKREAHGEELTRMRRVLIHAYPAAQPEAVVLVDVAERAIHVAVKRADRRDPLESFAMTEHEHKPKLATPSMVALI